MRRRSNRAERSALEQDIADELASHLDHCADDLASAGLSLDAARSEARRRFGNTDTIHAACRREDLYENYLMQQLTIGLLALMLVGLAFFTVRQSHAQAVERERITEMHEQLTTLNANFLALPEDTFSGLQMPPEEPTRPESGWVYDVGDTIEIVDSLNPITFGQAGPIRVEPDGQALFPDAGWVMVADRSRQELEQELRQRYKVYYAQIEPRVVLVARGGFSRITFR